MKILNSKTINLKGILQSSNATEIQNEIEYALERGNFLIINISEITSIDISGVFMLYLIYIKAKKVQKMIQFKGMENETIQKAMWMAGVKIPSRSIAA